jgi:hypothetical protein
MSMLLRILAFPSLMLFTSNLSAEVPTQLQLSCPGSSTGMLVVESASARVTGQAGTTASANGSRSEITTIRGTVNFRLSDGIAEINVPAQFLPTLHGGKAGWFKVKELSLTDDEIIGKVSLNFLNSSRFRIDRRSGMITTSGGFTGECSKMENQSVKF